QPATATKPSSTSPGKTMRVPRRHRRAFAREGAWSRRTARARRSTSWLMVSLPSFVLDVDTVYYDADAVVLAFARAAVDDHRLKLLEVQKFLGIVRERFAGRIYELDQDGSLGQL